MTAWQSDVGRSSRQLTVATSNDGAEPGCRPPDLWVRLLGAFQVSAGDRAVCGPVLRKSDELLALVLLAPQRSVRREVAADALWPSSAPGGTKKAIRQALWQIHQATDAAVSDRQRLVLTEGEAILVNPDRTVWVDVDAFNEAAQLAQAKRADALSGPDIAQLTHGADLYGGPLLSGCGENWCLVKRAHLEDLHITLLDKLSTAHEQRGDLESAIRWAQRLLEVEPAHERSHRRLMHLYVRIDNRTRALRQFRRCRRILEQELGVRPSPRTERLAAAISAGMESSPDRRGGLSSANPGPAPSIDTDVLNDLRSELAALRASLDSLSAQLGD